MTTLAAKPTKPIKESLFEVIETDFGTWRKFKGDRAKTHCGYGYSEFTSHAEVFGRPLVSIVNGMYPGTKKLATANGFIAIGQRAKGTIAIGQFCNGGAIAIGQFCTSRFFALGQFALAPIAVGQFSMAVLAVGQMGICGAGVYQAGLSLWQLLLG